MSNDALLLGWRKLWNRSLHRFIGRRVGARVDIEDLAGRFNLNALLIQGQIDQVTLNRWTRLLALLELPPLQLEQVGALRELSQLGVYLMTAEQSLGWLARDGQRAA